MKKNNSKNMLFSFISGADLISFTKTENYNDGPLTSILKKYKFDKIVISVSKAMQFTDFTEKLTNIVNIILNDNKKIEIKILECNIEFHKIEKLDKYIFETIDEERKNNIYKEQINDVYINYMSGTPQSKLSLQFYATYTRNFIVRLISKKFEENSELEYKSIKFFYENINVDELLKGKNEIIYKSIDNPAPILEDFFDKKFIISTIENHLNVYDYKNAHQVYKENINFFKNIELTKYFEKLEKLIVLDFDESEKISVEKFYEGNNMQLYYYFLYLDSKYELHKYLEYSIAISVLVEKIFKQLLFKLDPNYDILHNTIIECTDNFYNQNGKNEKYKEQLMGFIKENYGSTENGSVIGWNKLKGDKYKKYDESIDDLLSLIKAIFNLKLNEVQNFELDEVEKIKLFISEIRCVCAHEITELTDELIQSTLEGTIKRRVHLNQNQEINLKIINDNIFKYLKIVCDNDPLVNRDFYRDMNEMIINLLKKDVDGRL